MGSLNISEVVSFRRFQVSAGPQKVFQIDLKIVKSVQ